MGSESDDWGVPYNTTQNGSKSGSREQELGSGGHLVEVEQHVVQRLLRRLAAARSQRLDGFDGLLRTVLLLHHDGHVLQGAVHAVVGVDGLPEEDDGAVRVLVDELGGRGERREGVREGNANDRLGGWGGREWCQ